MKETNSLLKELLESSRNLPHRDTGVGTLQLGLSEVRRQTNELRKHHQDQDGSARAYTRAHYLLAPSGVTAEEIENELASIESVTAHWDPLATAANVELSLDIAAKKDENILIAIEQSLANAARDFDSFVNQNISMDWNSRKNELRNSFNIILNNSANLTVSKTAKTSLKWKSIDLKNAGLNKGEFADVKLPSLPSENLVNPNISYALRQRFETHAEIIYDLNETRQANKPYALSLVFCELSKQNTDIKSRQLHETWKIIDNLCNSQNQLQFAGQYQKPPSSFDATQLRKKIVANSIQFLEQQFMDYINESYRTTINSSNKLNPTNLEKLKFFLDSKLKQNNEWKIKNLSVINGTPIWATIFYLLRAGLYQDALDITLQNKDNFQKLEKTFPIYLKSFVNSNSRKLPQELHERLHLEFNQYFKHLNKESDPYRYAVYKIIGRCDLMRKNLPHITSSIEDWLWVHLSFTREDNIEDDPIHERYTLLDLQQNIIQLGPENFNGSSNNSLYLQTLVYCGLYELAVQYLYTINEVDAVHLAIGLQYYGLIRPTDEITESLIKTDNGVTLLNFAGLIISYIRSFKKSDPRIACEYLILICLNVKNKEICHENIRKLVLETREFTMLLGSIDKDGVRIPGVIEQRKSLILLSNEDEFLTKITGQAAVRADEEGRFQESILLYQLSKEYNSVIIIVNKLMGELLNVTEYDKILSKDEEIINVANNLSMIYNLNQEISSKIELKNKETCSNLLKLIKLHNSFALKNWENCLKIGEELSIIPISSQQINIGQFKRLSQDFIKLDDSIVRNIPQLLVIVMTCLIQIIRQLKESKFNVNEEKIAKMTNIGKNCMIFAGMIEYKMPRETYSTLINLESMI